MNKYKENISKHGSRPNTAGQQNYAKSNDAKNKAGSGKNVCKAKNMINNSNVVLCRTTEFLIPIIIVFGFYVFKNADYSPGGGFQAGMIIASAFIAHALVFDNLIITKKAISVVAVLGVLTYVGVGCISLICNKNFLDYSALNTDALFSEKLGMVIVEIGVTAVVSSSMLLIYYCFHKLEAK